MRKLLALLTVGVLALTGCGAASEGAGTNGDGKITVYNLKVEIDEALKEYASVWSEANGVDVEIKSVGGGADYGASLQAEFQSGNEPDIFVSAGSGDFAQWSDVVYDMSGEEWTEYTDLEYIDENGATVGFPIAIEGYGLIANTEILDEAGIDASTVSTYDDLVSTFETLDSQKEELGIDSVLSFTTKETWVTGNHLFNILLAGSGMTSEEAAEATEAFINGDTEALATENYGEFVSLLNNYSYGDLSTIDYDTEVANFATGKTALLFQGNWAIGNIESAGYDVSNLTFLPLAYNDATAGKLPVGVPSYYAVNKNTDVDLSLQFLNDMAMTEEGHDYIVNGAMMIPAFTNVEIKPEDALAVSIMEYNEAGNTLPWLFVEFPDGYGMNTYGPIYDNFAKNDDVDSFISNITQTAGNIR